MRKSWFSKSQLIQILNEWESGIQIANLCREHSISRSAYYKWKAKYGGMDGAAMRRLKELEEENRRLKKMYAELSLEHQVLKDIVEKKL